MESINEAGRQPQHLLRLPDEAWALWHWVGLRSAGFPAERALALADPTCAALADRVLEAEAQVHRARGVALAELHAALDALRNGAEDPGSGRRRRLLDALRRLKQGQPPAPPSAGEPEAGAYAAFEQARMRHAAAREDFSAAFDAAMAHTSEVIAATAADDRFREALIWHNRRAYHTGVTTLRRPGAAAGRNSKQRQHEELVASYLQRYCLKNDTIGFFGPVGWAKLVPHGAALTARPGPGLLAARRTYFEQWAIDGLAAALAADPWLRPWLAPRLLPHVHLSGTNLHRPSKGAAKLAPAQAAVLGLCTGERIAKEIVAEIRRSHAHAVKSDVEVYKLLEQFGNLGLIAWTLEAPFEAHPEQGLRRRLEAIGEARLRAPALAALDELDGLRGAVARAAGDAAGLDQALGRLEATYTRVTGAAATRGAGASYAGRTLVYEDARRDIEVEIGPDLLRELGPPLALLLTSARWFTYEAAAVYRAAFRQIYEDLARQAGAPTVELVHFWQQVQVRLLGNARPVERVVRALQERWAGVLAIPEGRRQVTYDAAALRERVAAAFAAGGPGWQAARYHSPDVMIAAESAAAIRQGAYQLVMGELHLGSNTLRGSLFIQQHPAPDELYAALAHDLPQPRVVPITPRNWPEITSRTRPDFVTAQDFRLAFTNDACGIPPGRLLPIGALVVREGGDGPVVCLRDGPPQFDIVEFFGDILSLEIVDGFKIFGPLAHTPRVSVDRLVICREAWRFAPAAMAFATLKHEAERFMAARRWAQIQGLPRHVFIKAPIERKPFYVDFDSPILVNLLAKTVRRSSEPGRAGGAIVVTEMLPAYDQLWLQDSGGRRYTSELRLVALDLQDPVMRDA